MAPGHVWVNITTHSYFSSAPSPGRPTTSAVYFAALDVPGANSSSVALGMSEPAMRAIPLNRSFDAVAQPDLRRVPDVATRAADVEGAAFGKEVDATAINRRLNTKGRADRFARGSGHPERPDRQVHRRRRHARHVCDHADQLVQRRDLAARQNVRLICGGRVLAAQPKAFHKI